MIEAAIGLGVLVAAVFVGRKMLRDSGVLKGRRDCGCGGCATKRARR